MGEEDRRCKRSAGPNRWRCGEKASPGKSYCDKHLAQQVQNQTKKRNQTHSDTSERKKKLMEQSARYNNLLCISCIKWNHNSDFLWPGLFFWSTNELCCRISLPKGRKRVWCVINVSGVIRALLSAVPIVIGSDTAMSALRSGKKNDKCLKKKKKFYLGYDHMCWLPNNIGTLGRRKRKLRLRVLSVVATAIAKLAWGRFWLWRCTLSFRLFVL